MQRTLSRSCVFKVPTAQCELKLERESDSQPPSPVRISQHSTDNFWSSGVNVESSAVCIDDYDLQLVVVNGEGTSVDAVDEQRLVALDGLVRHSGKRTISIDIDKVSTEVALFVVVALARSNAPLDHIRDANLCLTQPASGRAVPPFARVPLQEISGEVSVIAVMKLTREGTWSVRNWPTMGHLGSHYVDILDDVREVVRKNVPGACSPQKLALPMVSGDMVCMPRTSVSQTFRFHFGWEFSDVSIKVDLDVSAVMFTRSGKCGGAVWFETKEAPGIVHGGDDEELGHDETVSVHLPNIPRTVHTIIFVVSIYSKAVSLDLLKKAWCSVVDEHGVEFAHFNLDEQRNAKAVAMARLTRYHDVPRSERWAFQAMGTFCRGRAWMDPRCRQDLKQLATASMPDYKARHMELQIRDEAEAAKAYVPDAEGNVVVQDKVMFRDKERRLKTGGAVDLREAFKRVRRSSFAAIPRLVFHVGVGWDLMRSARNGVDLDISIVLFTRSGKNLGAVYFDNPQEYGIRHSGDNRTGEGSGDNEVVDLDLRGIPEEVEHIFFLLNVYTKDMTFSVVQNAYCHLYDELGNQLLYYNLDSFRARSKSGLVIARMYRDPVMQWAFEAAGSFCCGRSWMDPGCMEHMKRLILMSELKRASSDTDTGCPSTGTSACQSTGAPPSEVDSSPPSVRTMGIVSI